MASYVIQSLNAAQIEQAISGAYYNIIVRGSGFVRDTGVQNISGQKTFYDDISFSSGAIFSGDLIPSGEIVGSFIPKTDNLYNLGSSSKEWANLFIDGTGRIDSLHVDESAFITGNLSVLGNTTLTGDFFPTNVASHFLPKTDDLYSLGSSTQEFKDLWIDGTGRIDTLHVDENFFVTGNSILNGDATVVGSLSSSVVLTVGSGSFGQLFVTGSNIPVSTTSPGVKGEIVVGSGHLYCCTGENLWARVALTGWV